MIVIEGLDVFIYYQTAGRRPAIDWVIDWLIDWLTDWLTDWLIDQLTVDIHRRLEKFDLYYYDGLARQDEELRLTVGEHAFLRVNRHSVTYVVLVGYIAVTG